ncbi:hypothetical protein AB0G02_40780, partial [Actinosynnema sp. NPDC023658]|uniref:hypothetical protein n=1 Tax=Actinosynnema sp. NPDC023658 TaxID=3155465 RepID=UPI0033CB1C72
MAQTRPEGSAAGTTRVKVLRSVWETGWSGAAPVRPWSDRHFADAFGSAAGFWSRATSGLVSLAFDVGPWSVLAGGSQAELMSDRAAIVAACRRQARRDRVTVEGYDHVIAFVHEPPADTGVWGRDLVLDQTVPRWTRHRQIGRLLGFGRALGPSGSPDDPYCVMGAGRCGLSAASQHRYAGGTGVATVHTGPGATVELTALSEPDGGPVLAVVPVPGGRLTVEYRTDSGDDVDLRAAGVVDSRRDDSPSVSCEAA